MNPRVELAVSMMKSSRLVQAEDLLRQALMQDPNDGLARCWLAICFSSQEKYSEAMREAEQAVQEWPELSFSHHVLAYVLEDRNCYDEAAEAVGEAIRIGPCVGNFELLSRIRFSQSRWQEALDAAEQGLELDPEDVDCTNLRATALVKLGRKMEAGASIHDALSLDPDNAFTHANLGWNLIEQGDPKRALPCFREALRLNPQLEYARAGIVEALKARNPIYRLMLRYFLWMAKLSDKATWGIVIGGYVGQRILQSIANSNPEIAPWIMPLVIAYWVFAIMTWISQPLFDLLLRLNRFGRLALSREQIVASNWVGLYLAAALSSLGGYFYYDNIGLLAAALTFGLTIPPLSSIRACDPGWPRRSMIFVTAGLTYVGLMASGLLWASTATEGRTSRLFDQLGALLMLAFVVGAFASQFLAIAVAKVVVRR